MLASLFSAASLPLVFGALIRMHTQKMFKNIF